APLVLAASTLDVMLGALLLTRWEGAALALMAISVAAYTAALGVTSPALWIEPTGGLLKNFALLGLVAVLAATRGRR
ncbi:MAG TPA: DoxX-like family protein, partial [Usitatibacteraceae bacterium]|nr:DoxX-like family protein [Usitatibacteraceae bacterium]